MNTARMKWIKMSKNKRKSKIKNMNRNLRSKVKAERSKVLKYLLKNNRSHNKNTWVQHKLSMSMKGMFQARISDFMTVKINPNKPAERRAHLTTITKVSPRTKWTLTTINRVSHNFPNFRWAAATPKDKSEKSREGDTIDSGAFELPNDIFLEF